MISPLIQDMLNGSAKALAKAISMVENRISEAALLLENVAPVTQPAQRIGITGPPGAGKSTIVDQITREFRATGKKVAILSVDPTSPFSGGALLGDRYRMAEHYTDAGVFIRSMATRGAVGGLAGGSRDIADLLEAAKYDTIIFETVGVGQLELDVVESVDTTIVVLVPESGDEIQLMKAGIIEIADIFMVNKADRDGAEQLAKALQQLLEFREDDSWNIPVCLSNALTGAGIDEVMAQISAHRTHLQEHGLAEIKRFDRRRRKVKELVRESTEAQFWTAKREQMLDHMLQEQSAYQTAKQLLESI